MRVVETLLILGDVLAQRGVCCAHAHDATIDDRDESFLSGYVPNSILMTSDRPSVFPLLRSHSIHDTCLIMSLTKKTRLSSHNVCSKQIGRCVLRASDRRSMAKCVSEVSPASPAPLASALPFTKKVNGSVCSIIGVAANRRLTKSVFCRATVSVE